MGTSSTPDPRRWLALAVLGVAYLMVVLDVSIVNVALPSIQSDLGFSPEDLQWVVSGYALTFGGFLLLGGRAGDVLGRRRLFMVGLALFAIFSALLRARPVRHDADHLPPAPGRRLGRPRAVGLLDHDGHVPGGRRAQQGAGDPRRDRGRGRRHRRAPRRHPHRVRRLGVGVLDQRPDRHPHAHLRAAVRAGEPRRGHEPQLRRPGRRDGHREPAAAGVRARRRPTRTAGAPAETIGVAGRLRGADGRVPVSSRRAAAARSDAAALLEAAHARGRQHGRLRARDDRVQHVLPAVALHAAGARVLGARRPASATSRSR